jgi:hypothetical protein
MLLLIFATKREPQRKKPALYFCNQKRTAMKKAFEGKTELISLE